jgi:hypothetical protein
VKERERARVKGGELEGGDKVGWGRESEAGDDQGEEIIS